LDELMNLLRQLDLGAASDLIYDMIMDLETDAMTRPQLEQAIRSILVLHGREACADAVIAALSEVSFFDTPAPRRDGEGEAADADGHLRTSGPRTSAER
jgi:hypothetical protein